jgi:hypothetical protein
MNRPGYALPLVPGSGAGTPRLGAAHIWLAPLLLLPIALMGPNRGLGLYACLVLGVGLGLLWRRGEPPILPFIFLYQWFQAALGVFYGNLVHLPVYALVRFPGRDDMAVFLLLTGLAVLALAARLTAGPAIRGLLPLARTFVAARPLKFWLLLFVAAWVFSTACTALAGRAGGFRQPLLALSEVKWAAFILLTLATFAVPGRSKVGWLAVFGFQFALSIGGFFSSFKEVFFYSLIGLAASNVRFTVRIVLPAAVLAGALLLLGVIWTAVKGEYRAYVNAGSGQQVVLVDYEDRLTELVRLVSQLDGQAMANAADQMARRIMYYEFFGVVLERVPSLLPHSNGAIWGEAALRAVTPRLLFPDKQAINDSELTNLYTGLGVASYRQGTSVSIGYMAEAYVDFGPVFMFILIAALGLFLGFAYRWLLTRPGRSGVLGMALAPFALMPANYLETSSLKLVPSLVLSAAACLVILYVLGPRLFRPAVRAGTLRSAGPARPTGA